MKQWNLISIYFHYQSKQNQEENEKEKKRCFQLKLILGKNRKHGQINICKGLFNGSNNAGSFRHILGYSSADCLGSF